MEVCFGFFEFGSGVVVEGLEGFDDGFEFLDLYCSFFFEGIGEVNKVVVGKCGW